MSNRGRSVGALVLAAVLAVALGACGDSNGGNGSGTPGSPSSGAATGPPSGRLLVQAAGGDGELAALREVVAAFEASHPAVDVDFVGLADQGEHIAKLATGFAAGRPPDVFLLNYRRFGRFAAAGVIDPPPGVDAAAFYPAPLEAFTLDGRLQCLPQNVSSTVTYYNPALFRRAGVPPPTRGWTLDDLRSAARRIAARGIEAVGFEPSMRTVAPFVWAHGGEVVDALAAPTAITLDTPAGRAALSYLADLQRSGVTPAEAAAETVEDRFARGELAMLLDSRRAVPSLRKAGLSFDVAPLPRGERAATLLASDAYCVARAAGNRSAAHAFARYVVGPVGARLLARTGRTVPSLRSVAESPDFLDPGAPPASARVWLDVVPTLRRLPNVGTWNEAETAASDVLEQFFAGRVPLGSAVERITRDSRRLLARG